MGICQEHAHAADALFLKPPWTKFAKGIVSPEVMKEGFTEVWVNSRYQVLTRRTETEMGPLVHLSIKRLDKLPIHDWRDLQRIKNELLGPESEACELYPGESRLVDTSSQFHLWSYPGKRAPFGFEERLVSEGSTRGAKQRPFEKGARPDDCWDSKHLDEIIENRNKEQELS